uniref:Uncharacterized protein n=1 Tax=Meloidogyne incognita TaxID=6306 RepID=A0A914LM62_MELIC
MVTGGAQLKIVDHLISVSSVIKQATTLIHTEHIFLNFCGEKNLEKIRQENILHGNPLLTQNTDFKVKRRWDDDVVFKNCARGIDERKKTPSFINDAIRSEFHRKFMEKYIK